MPITANPSPPESRSAIRLLQVSPSGLSGRSFSLFPPATARPPSSMPPSRPTETPGVTAWLHLALKRYRAQIADPERARLYGEIADWQDRRSVPPSLAAIRDLLAAPVDLPAVSGANAPRWADAGSLGTDPAGGPAGGRAPLQFRAQRFVEIDGSWLVVTRRKALDEAGSPTPSDRFLERVSPRLLRLGQRLGAALAAHPLPAVPGPVPPRVARVYALSEDGTLVTLPLGELTGDLAARRRAAAAEGRELRKLPQLPSFVSNEFFFQFDFTRPAGQVYYSGLYLDLGGQGVVATVTVPYVDPASGAAGILGADITFALDWRAFARQIEPPMIAEVVTLPTPPEERSHTLGHKGSADDAFVVWLSGYVERRLRVTAWLLDHWDAEPPLPPACAIEPSHARETLAALERIFARVAADPELRSSLHWDNGALASPGGVLSISIDWPARYWFPLPVRGGFGLFLEEVLVNAVRHGRPGSVPRLALHVDSGRRELLCEVENETRDDPGARQRIEPYGGRRILERLAGLFGWEGLIFEECGGRFAVSWRVPVSEREEAGEAD